MATHKVPQDVETEDKIIGFLSLKQFIFVVVGLGFGYLMFFFATKINVFLSLIWLPFTVVPLVLGLYQRRDQPVEVFLASAIRYHLKPRKRKWDQEGYEERVVVTVPPKVIHKYTKDFTGEEAMSRLTGLSHMMDSRGWASKLAGDWQNPQLAMAAASDNRLVQPNQVAAPGAYLQTYAQPVDVMDENTSLVAQDFQNKINKTDYAVQNNAIQSMAQAQNSSSAPLPEPHLEKYPQMQQSVVQPISSDTPVSGPVTQTPLTPPAPIEPTSPEETITPTPAEPPQKIDDDGSVEISLR